MSHGAPSVAGMEFFLIAFVAVLWWQLSQARRRARETARSLSALSADLGAVRWTLRANTDGFAYWYSGPTLVRAPLVDGVADPARVEPADPATCPDLTAEGVAEIARALERAADDLLHNGGELS